MSVVEQVFQSSNHRSIALRKRPDLTVVQQYYRNESFWLIKDPLEMEFYRLNDEEFAVLELLDGKASLDDVKTKFERQFSPQRITHRQLQAFVADLRKKSLLAFTNGDTAPQLMERRIEKQNEKLKSKVMSLFAIKWRGVDPDRFLDFLTGKIGWLFSLPAVILSTLMMITALGLLLVNYTEFISRLPSLSAFLSSSNWLLLGIVVMCMKVIHELAHGMVFKRFGGECHEIGVMLLVLIMPTLYCNTSDSWMLKSKWQRAAIGAAGMYIELIVAAIATFIWWYGNPGTVSMICLNIMATGTVSVVMMNGNPFFKFDGYYIFSDIFELPNLMERSGKQTFTWFLNYGLGIEEPGETNSLESTKWWLVSFCVLSFLFRIFIIFMIGFMLTDRLAPYGLSYVGLAAGVLCAILIFFPAVSRVYKFFKVPGKWQRIEMKNSVVFSIGLCLVLGLIFLIPFPHYVNCPFTIQPQDSQAVYVDHEAVLKEVLVEPRQQVAAGDLIARLENLDVSLQLAELKMAGEEQAAELELLEQTRRSSADDAARIRELKQALKTNRASIAEYQEIIDSFQVIADRDGQVIPEWSASSAVPTEELESFAGSAFDPENIGASFESGQKLCMIGDLKKFDAVLNINEYDVRFTRPGQSVTLMLESRSGSRVAGKIATVAQKETDSIPESLSDKYGGSISLDITTATEKSAPKPTDEHFEALVALPELSNGYSSGLRGQARIHVGSTTIFSRLMRLGYRSFHKKLN